MTFQTLSIARRFHVCGNLHAALVGVLVSPRCGQSAFAGYARLRPGTRFQVRSIHVLNLRRKKLNRITIFIGPKFVSRFKLSPELDTP